MAEEKIEIDEVEDIFDLEEDRRITPKVQEIIDSLRHIGPKMLGSIGKKGGEI